MQTTRLSKEHDNGILEFKREVLSGSRRRLENYKYGTWEKKFE
jgi:hypothetical protein